MSKFFAFFAVFALFGSSLLAADENPLSLEGGVNVSNAYYLRGLKQESNGIVIQPSANVKDSLYHNSTGIVSDVRVFGGIFESIQSSNDTQGSAWFESDVSAGGGFTLANTLNFDAFYWGSTSPNGAFEALQEADFRFSINDKDLWTNTFFGQKLNGFTGFRPYALYGYELSGHLANRFVSKATVVNTTGAGYLEVGVNPGFDVYKNVVLSVPVKVGFSTNNYYNDGSGINYGYSSVGVQLEIPLCPYASFVAGVESDFLGSEVKALNGDGKDVEVIGHVGLTIKF